MRIKDLYQSTLAKNTLMLYILTGSNYILGFITVPYLTRVLGAETYGVVGFGQAVATYIQLVIDFGFILSATAEITNCHEDRNRISQVMSAVIQAKTIICVICILVLLVVCRVVPQFRGEMPLIGLFFAYAVVNSLMPDYVYRGLEMMSAITVRAVALKSFFVVCIFLFVRGPRDYLMVPLLYLVGALLAIVVVYAHLANRLGIHYSFVGLYETLQSLKGSFTFFLSRIASTVYSTMNMFVIGMLYPSSVELGCYTATDKAISAGKTASSPVADSIYPYMLRTKNYSLLIKISIVGSTILTIVSIVIIVFAEPICLLLFGEEYVLAAPMMRILSPTIPLALISYLYGFPALAPIGKSDYANLSVGLAAIIQICLILISWFLNDLSVTRICLCTLSTELFVALFRLFVFFHAYRKIKTAEVD